MKVRMFAAVAAFVASAGVFAQVPPVPKPVPPPPPPQGPGQARDAQAQAQAPATAFIMGTVVVNGTGQPADGVRLTLSGNELRGTRSALSDDSGNFAFLALPPGTYTLRATKNGWVSGTYGQKQPGRPGTAIVLGVGQQLKGVSLEVARGGVVSGTITDEKNRPAVRVSVRVMQWTWQSGERVLSQTGSGTTDDRGIYRVFGLAPGDYVVNAAPPNNSGNMLTNEDMQSLARMEELGRMFPGAPADMSKLVVEREMIAAQPNSVNNEPVSGYAPVYYPGTPQPGNAQAVKVGISQEQLGIDFQLQRVPLSRVTGTVMVPSGVTSQNVQVRLIETAAQVPGMAQFSARPNPQGVFTFNAVPPGQYQVTAIATMPVNRPPTPAGAAPEMMIQAKVEMEAQMNSGGGRRLWAVQDVTVDGAYAPNVALTLQEGMTITGSVSFDGTAAQPQLNRIRLTLGPLGRAMQQNGVNTVAATADANGRFTFAGVAPGQYRIRASGATGWTMKGVMADGKDTLDFPLEVKPGENLTNVNVEFTDKFTDLKGSIQSPTGQPTSDFTVIIFPSDQRYWVPLGRRIRSVRPSTDGKFSFSGLPAGDYRIAAVTDVEPGGWNDPALLQQLMNASLAVRLVEGQPVVQDLRVSGGY